MKQRVNVLSLVFLWLFTSQTWAVDLPDFTTLVSENSNAVVNISTIQKNDAKPSGLPPNLNLPENSPYGELFRHFFGDPNRRMPKQRESRSLGSGFLISKDGYLLTNHHVIKGADEIIVRLQDRRELKAKLIGSDESTDIALLKVEGDDLPTVRLGSSKNLKVGEWVFAIGSPFGFDSSVTAGIVSAKGRSLPQENYVPFIQTDVAINPGNSGGPLFNLKGEVVGINSQIYSRSGGFMGLSFAIPVDVAMNVSEQLKDSGKVLRGWLGVRIQDVTRELAQSFDMDKPYGALVAQVVPDSPAEKAGLKTGDVIIEFNDQEVDTSASLPPMVGSSDISKKAKVKVIRNKKTRTLFVKLENLPADDVIAESPKDPVVEPDTVLGMTVVDLTVSTKKKLEGVEQGVLVKSVSSGVAADAGIRSGDVIIQFDGQTTQSVKQFRKQVDKLREGKFVSVLIYRDGGPIFIALKT